MNSINNNNALNLSNSMSTAISSDLVGESFSQEEEEEELIAKLFFNIPFLDKEIIKAYEYYKTLDAIIENNFVIPLYGCDKDNYCYKLWQELQDLKQEQDQQGLNQPQEDLKQQRQQESDISDDDKDDNYQNLRNKLVPTSQEFQQFITNCLDKLIIYQPENSFKFLATLLNLPNDIKEFENSINAFYWSDKAESELAQYKYGIYNMRIIDQLKKLSETFKLIILATNQKIYYNHSQQKQKLGEDDARQQNSSLFLKGNLSDFPYELCYKSVSSSLWYSFVKYRFVVSKKPQQNYQNYQLFTTFKSTDKSFFGRMVTPEFDDDDHGENFEFKISDQGVII
ncbi:2001_t:CDS:2 [Entrophospora sp. SA101]|nr:2001_t:CDS:2 [Entrophospora sp. SA101]